jgi:hypothetical protein
MPKKFKPETVTHHLTTVVVGLTAVLGTLSIYSFFYVRQPDQPRPNRSPQVAAASTAPLPEILPTAQSLTGTVKTVSANRLTLAVVSGRGGSRQTRLVNVTLTPATAVTVVAADRVEALSADGRRPRIVATRRRIKPGRFVEVASATAIGQATAMIAERVDIIETER